MAATWNIAAVNNNPFEYWITHEDAAYSMLMADVENFFEAPGDRDIPVFEVFSDARFDELLELMRLEDWEGLDTVKRLWKDDYRERRIIRDFFKDKELGAKRLASMPDRITNTIRLADEKRPAYRPTIINQYAGSLDSVDAWWLEWMDFMFKQSFQITAKNGTKVMRPCQMLSKISRAKYPKLTEEEEEVSLPLQLVCLAVFDAVLVHIMLSVSPDGKWQAIKRSITDALYDKKDANIVGVLRSTCMGADVICLQEAAAAFREQLIVTLGADYHVIVGDDVDPTRNQNSMVMLRKIRFPHGLSEELTAQALMLMSTAPVERGDLIAIRAHDALGKPVLVVSFHGDTNGLATKPVVSAVAELLKQQPSGCQLVFGLDANTYLQAKEGMQGVGDFLTHCGRLGIRSCWPEAEPMDSFCTTCIARTYLQPQLNKAVRGIERIKKADLSPKDHILVFGSTSEVISCHKDNTGKRLYIEGEVFPSMKFPSDHGLVWAILGPAGSKL